MAAGAPCLVIPDAAWPSAGFDRILIAWNASREAKRAVDDALVFLKAASAVRIFSAGERPSLEDPTGMDLSSHLARHGVVAEVARRDRVHNAGQAILAACDDFHAGLLVMGAYGRAKLAETLLGGVSSTVLAEARLPVLMAH
jgi:nucleotide-binding universal stress UspA family protein